MLAWEAFLTFLKVEPFLCTRSQNWNSKLAADRVRLIMICVCWCVPLACRMRRLIVIINRVGSSISAVIYLTGHSIFGSSFLLAFVCFLFASCFFRPLLSIISSSLERDIYTHLLLLCLPSTTVLIFFFVGGSASAQQQTAVAIQSVV